MSSDSFGRLDIGCGNNKTPDSIYLDINKDANPDIVHDLNKFPYPIEDNSIDEIVGNISLNTLTIPRHLLRSFIGFLNRGELYLSKHLISQAMWPIRNRNTNYFIPTLCYLISFGRYRSKSLNNVSST